MKSLSCFIVILSLYFIGSWSYLGQAYASEQQYQQDVKKVNLAIQQITQKLNQNKSYIKSEQHRIHLLDKEIYKKQKELGRIQIEIRNKKEKITQNKSKVSALYTQYQQSQQELKIVVAQQYKHGTTSYLKTVLNQNSPDAVGRINAYYRYYQRAYQEKLLQIKKNHSAFLQQQTAQKRLLQNLERHAQQAQRKKNAMHAVKTQRNKKIHALTKQANAENTKLQQLKSDQKRLLSLIRALVQQAKEAAKQRKTTLKDKNEQARKPSNIQKGRFIKQKKRLSYPVKGKIQYGFGERLQSFGLISEGVFFSTNGAQDVHTIFSGTVIFADVLKGYGLLLIIDHGDNYISLYGHNDKLYKKLGDRVTANEVIAKTGTSGGLTQSGLYFEIRNNTQPINPAQWCR